MPIIESIKQVAEIMTGLGRPDREQVDSLVRPRLPRLLSFKNDGYTPNNQALPLIIYRTPVRFPVGLDPAAVFEELFAANGWQDSWRDGIYDFLHFHTGTHEVLGIARGRVAVQFGGEHGKRVDLKTGDVAVLPAGTGHKNVGQSPDLLVVGAYPTGGDYDEIKPSELDIGEAQSKIARVKLPPKDPVYGSAGGVSTRWHRTSR